MTTLATQLRRLSTPATIALKAAESSKKPSLLYTGDEAADLDVETVYALGVNGLAELQSMNPVFQTFQNSLFSSASMSFERTQQTSGNDEKLNTEICRFLIAVSPYVLLRPAQKALEWLIRTFRIHSFNTDALVACILPYHNTTLFVHVLQLLPVKNPSSRWHWLLPAQKSRSPLSRFTVLQQCQSVPSFLQFICDLVERAVGDSYTGYSVLISFYTSTMVSLLNSGPVVGEQLLTYLVPSCMKSLRCNHGELKAGGYMVLGQLAVRAVLERKVVVSLVDCVCRHVEAGLLPAAIACLVCVAQTQTTKISKRSLRSLCRQPELVPTLASLSQTHNVSALLRVLLPAVLRAALSKLVPAAPGSDSETEVHGGKADYVAVITEAIHLLPLPDDLPSILAGAVVESYVQLRSESEELIPQEKAQAYGDLSRALNLRYPSGTDQALATLLTSIDEAGDESTLRFVHDFMEMTLCGTRNQVLLDKNSARILTFNHPQAHVRCLAIKQAHRSLSKSAEGDMAVDNDFFATSFVDRLGDEESSVCKCVLDLNKVLLKVVQPTILTDALLKLLDRCRINYEQDVWCSIAGQAIALLCRAVSQESSPPPFFLSTLLSAWQHLWLTQRHQPFSTVLLKSLKSSSKKSRTPLLSSLSSCASNCLSSLGSAEGLAGLAAANGFLLKWILECALSMECPASDVLSQVKEWCEAGGENSKQQRCSMVTLMMCSWLRTEDPRKTGSQLACCQGVLKLIQPLLENVKEGSHRVSVKKGKELVSKTCVKTLDSVLLADAEGSGAAECVLSWWSTVLVVSWSVKCTTAAMDVPDGLKDVDWWCEDSCTDEVEKRYLQTVRLLLPLLLDLSANVPQARPKRLITQLTEKHLKTPQLLLKALTMVWTEDLLPAGDGGSSEENAFHSAALCLRKAAQVFETADDVQALVGGSSPVMPGLLCGLYHGSADVREAALSTCTALAGKCSEKSVTGANAPLLPVMEVMVELAVQVGADAQVVTDTLATKMTMGGSSKAAKLWHGVMKLLVELSVSQAVPLHVKLMLLACLDSVPSKDWLPLTRDVTMSSLRQLFSETADKSSSSREHEYLRRLLHCQLQAANISNANYLLALETIQATLDECQASVDDDVSARDFVLPMITPPLFRAFPVAARQQLLSAFLDKICVPSADREVASRDGAALHKCVMQFPLDGEDILHELNKPGGVLSAPEESSPRKGRSKRRKLAEEPTTSPSGWQRAVVLLELLQNEDQVTNSHLLMPGLFRLLSMSIEADGDGLDSNEYTRQLILSGIHALCRVAPNKKRSKTGMLKADEFNVECVVRCVRASSNPQTHHHALLLLATAASLFPDRVLHNVMSIFTFMGANLLRMDDLYSFEVIQRTIQTVVPALVQVTSGGPSAAQSAHYLPIVVAVMRVFADAWPHMPLHRTDAIFHNLISTLGPETFLHLMLELLVERYIVSPSSSGSGSSLPSSAASSPTREGGDMSLALCDPSFPVQLVVHYDLSVQLKALHKLMEYVSSLPVTKPEPGIKAKKEPGQLPLFDVSARTEKQLQLYKVQLLTLIADVVTSDEFAIPDSSDEPAAQAVHEQLLSLLEMVMSFASKQTRQSVKQAEAGLKHYLRLIYTTAYKIVSAICGQLSVEVLVNVVLKLSAHKTSAIQNKALELLSAGLQKQDRRPWPQEQEPIFLGVVARLTEMLQYRLEHGVSSAASGREEMVTCQSALYCLKLLTCQLAARNPVPMLKVAGVVLDIMSSADCCPQVCASAVLCWGEAVASLGPQLVGDLARAVKALLAVLKASMAKENVTLLQIAVVTALGKLIVHLPSFLGKQLKNILKQLVHTQLCTEGIDSSATAPASGRSNLLMRAQAARMSIAVKVPVRVLFPAIHQCLTSIAKPSKVTSILSLLSVFTRAVLDVPKAEVLEVTASLTDFYLEVFDFIATNYNEFSEADMQRLQERAIKSFTTLVMRCSESTFRPVFNKLCRWADPDLYDKERLLVFFTLMFSLAERLKGLFVLFGAPVVDMAVGVLEKVNRRKHGDSFFSGGAANGVAMESDPESDEESQESSESDEEDSSMSDGESAKQRIVKSLAFPSAAWKSQRLAVLCMDTLLRLFKHDSNNKLVHKQVFEEVMPPLVDQLESNRGSSLDYQQFVAGHLVPCISQLAVAAGSVPLWKQMNTLLLAKTSSSAARVRFASLMILQELFLRLSEEYVALLPETIPVLAELLEDKSPEVEKQCQSLMKVIEDITGESIQSYF